MWGALLYANLPTNIEIFGFIDFILKYDVYVCSTC